MNSSSSKDNKTLTQLETLTLATINKDNVLEIKDYLANNWKPRTSSEAIKMKHLQHLFANAHDHINEECAAFLDRCKHCDNERIDTETGLKVLRKSKRSEKSYDPNPQLEQLESQLEEIKELIKIEKAKTNFAKITPEGYDYVVKF